MRAQVLDEPSYLRYQKKYAVSLEGSAGFYSPALDRLIIYNQPTSREVRRAGSLLARARKVVTRLLEASIEPGLARS